MPGVATGGAEQAPRGKRDRPLGTTAAAAVAEAATADAAGQDKPLDLPSVEKDLSALSGSDEQPQQRRERKVNEGKEHPPLLPDLATSKGGTSFETPHGVAVPVAAARSVAETTAVDAKAASSFWTTTVCIAVAPRRRVGVAAVYDGRSGRGRQCGLHASWGYVLVHHQGASRSPCPSCATYRGRRVPRERGGDRRR